jgi:hypothetical protein
MLSPDRVVKETRAMPTLALVIQLIDVLQPLSVPTRFGNNFPFCVVHAEKGHVVANMKGGQCTLRSKRISKEPLNLGLEIKIIDPCSFG